MTSRSRLWQTALLIVGALILPLLVLGLAFEEQVQDWVNRDRSTAMTFAAVVIVLASDLLLPVPSSGVSTYAGAKLGVVGGTLASWLGMTLGAIIGFAAARLLGRKFVDRQNGDDASQADELADRYGAASLILTRPLPLLAEAAVLMAGASGLSWTRFLAAVGISNLVISLAYSVCGNSFRDSESLPLILIASVLIPLGATVAIRRFLRTRRSEIAE